ncbi:hypothetical protein PAMP_008439 [Pampus punctatissimus]
MKGCTEEKEPGWRSDFTGFINTTQPPPFLHFAPSPLQRNDSMEWTRTINLSITGLFEKDVKLFVNQAFWRAVRKGFSTVCPSLLTLLDGRAAAICGRRRPPDCTATPAKMFVVATVCTQGRRML